MGGGGGGESGLVIYEDEVDDGDDRVGKETWDYTAQHCYNNTGNIFES